MLQRLRFRHIVGALLVAYQVTADFLQDITLGWYYDLAAYFGLQLHVETYEGPLIWVAATILHRAIIHTIAIYCFTGNRKFTHLYGVVEVVLIIGLVVLFISKLIFGEWYFFSFNFFSTFLDLLKSPLLLVIFLPSYFILKNQKDSFNP